MQKQLLTLIAVFLFTVPCAMSQDPDFEEFRRQQEQGFREFVAQRDSVMQAMNKEFDDYVEQRNREYAEYLKNEWERMQVFLGEKPEPGPKPDEIPPYDPLQEDAGKREERKAREETVIPTIPPSDARVAPRGQFREPLTVRPVDHAVPRVTQTLNIDFYGRTFTVDADRSFRGIRAYGTDEKNVSDWFDNAAKTNFTPTLVNLLDLAEETGMNDWALFMAARKLGDRLSNNNAVSSKLYTWFLLLQAGYDIRLGRQGNNLVFLMPFAHTVYNTPRLTIDNKTWYLIDGNSDQPVFTYLQTMPGAFRVFDMNFYKSPQFANRSVSKTLNINFRGQEYALPLQYDAVLVAMLAEQPQADMNIYLDADGSNYLVQSTQQVLEPILQPMSDVEKVSFLLHLSQNAFEYKTDSEKFGFQKYMVPDEVIHYTFSDCDDRAVLFGWLVRNYAGQKVAALLYPGHLASAVHFHNGNPPGDNLLIDGLEFVVADPTYINAPIGLTMPEFINVAPQGWIVDSDRYFFEQSISIWQQVHEMGGRRGNNQRDIAIGRNGDIYITGYQYGSMNIPETRLNASAGDSEKRTAFVAAFDKNMNRKWINLFSSNADATGFSIMLDSQENVLIAGSFSDELSLQNKKVVSEPGQNDAFVAAFRPSGQMLWMEKTGLNSQHSNNAMAYSAHLTLQGKVSRVHYYNDPRESISGLFPDGERGVVLTGTFGNTSGLTTAEAPELASAGRMDYADLLIQRNRELIQKQNIESSIAGLFAAIQLSKSEGAVFPGAAAQEALRKANPRFPSTFPTTFENIGKISFLRNKSGIIEIRTENGNDVFFDKLRIRDGSTVRVRTLPNGDEQIDILGNIHVGQAIVWYPLNFIRLYSRTGDLLFDYRRNNSQVTLNLKKDILN